MATMRERSRQDWNGEPNREDINSGSFQRIADACEKMAQSYDDMRRSRDQYKAWYEGKRAECDHLSNVIRSLRGTITRMKAKTIRGEA